ncbi:probable protein phosphatase 2C 74 isoform X2 [Asparagus officinalis]|uniref:probable protein phosphatase 2C 74 isoform X2 n=1 Tax=Asparagus officinalis TaxID=4686 RepID=UPI00098E7D75|nr:probable protein phosphatase 2C 74 isoform X2 [Asparagus officinalis]
MEMINVSGEEGVQRERRRPQRIQIPKPCFELLGFCEETEKRETSVDDEGFKVDGRSGYWLASRKGTRGHAMEDGYRILTNINGASRQAFFGVFDGHGGRAAMEFVREKLADNIVAALADLQHEDDQSLEVAVKKGYLATDTEFLSQGVRSGACVATVLLKDGELVASNVGDCRVVVSKNGVADALTSDHRASREDERIRIENSGGYVSCQNGVWRVQDSLAISRAIGDESLKKWISSEPETSKIHLTPDYEFLIIASDGLWDKVCNQEAVDIVLRHKEYSIQSSCKALVDLASSRGSRDDITVMLVDFQSFL